MRCMDCRYLAGSNRTPQWLFAQAQGYCDHPDREGGPWSALRCITNETTCKRIEKAPREKIDMRTKALKILRERYTQQTPPERLPKRGR